ncbi:MAG: D-alanyl-D-alanine carboxypeptidase family protein [Acidimicrobiales bacterium]
MRRAVAAGFVLLATVVAPEVSGAGPVQEPDLEEEQREVRERQGEVALEVDMLEASSAEMEEALATLDANVTTHQAQFDAANTAAAEADAALVEAEAAVTEAQGRVDVLNAASDELLIQSYVAPPAYNAWDTLQADSFSDAALMNAVLDMQAEEDSNVLELLEVARDDLTTQRDNRETAAADAETARANAAEALTRVQAARDQQAVVAAEADAALDHRLTEAANLAAIDEELSRQIAEEAAEQARLQAEAAEAAAAAARPAAGTVTPGPNGLATVSCHGGGSITVADTLASNLQALLDAAAGSGLQLCGGGYRDSQRQVELRKQNCGTSHYAIYQMPASQCSPPTARPGSSQHERGLAIDFANCSTRSTACYQWLAGNAANYGLHNLPSEAWHWSTTGK